MDTIELDHALIRNAPYTVHEIFIVVYVHNYLQNERSNSAWHRSDLEKCTFHRNHYYVLYIAKFSGYTVAISVH